MLLAGEEKAGKSTVSVLQRWTQLPQVKPDLRANIKPSGKSTLSVDGEHTSAWWKSVRAPKSKGLMYDNDTNECTPTGKDLHPGLTPSDAM